MTKKRAVARSGKHLEEEHPIEEAFDLGPELEEEKDGLREEEGKEEVRASEEEREAKKKPDRSEEERRNQLLEEEVQKEQERIEKEKEEEAEQETERETVEDPIPSREELEAKIIEERRKHEEGLQKEVQRLRKELYEVSGRSQSQPTIPIQREEPPISIMQDQIPFEIDEDGKKIKIDRAMLRAMIAEETKPDPVEQFRQQLNTARSQWIAEDSTERAPVAKRIEDATNYIELLSRHYSATTGHNPASISEWVQTIESGPLAVTFRDQFPEIDDVGGFIDAMFTGSTPEDRIWKIRRYMNSYVQSKAAKEDGRGKGEATTRTTEERGREGSEDRGKLVQLQTGKPRSIAERGRSSDKGTTDEQRYLQLMDQIGDNPIGTLDDEDYREAQQLARKLGIRM